MTRSLAQKLITGAIFIAFTIWCYLSLGPLVLLSSAPSTDPLLPSLAWMLFALWIIAWISLCIFQKLHWGKAGVVAVISTCASFAVACGVSLIALIIETTFTAGTLFEASTLIHTLGYYACNLGALIIAPDHIWRMLIFALAYAGFFWVLQGRKLGLRGALMVAVAFLGALLVLLFMQGCFTYHFVFWLPY